MSGDHTTQPPSFSGAPWEFDATTLWRRTRWPLRRSRLVRSVWLGVLLVAVLLAGTALYEVAGNRDWPLLLVLGGVAGYLLYGAWRELWRLAILLTVSTRRPARSWVVVGPARWAALGDLPEPEDAEAATRLAETAQPPDPADEPDPLVSTGVILADGRSYIVRDTPRLRAWDAELVLVGRLGAVYSGVDPIALRGPRVKIGVADRTRLDVAGELSDNLVPIRGQAHLWQHAVSDRRSRSVGDLHTGGQAG